MAGQGLPNKKRKETAKMALYRESVTKVPSNPFPNSSTAVVIMNGESRQGFDLEKLRKKDLAIFGCNAIYRTFPVDFLVIGGPLVIANKPRRAPCPSHPTRSYRLLSTATLSRMRIRPPAVPSMHPV